MVMRQSNSINKSLI